MSDIQFPEGIQVYAKSDKAPDYVGDTLLLDVAELISWLQGQKTEKVRLQIMKGKTGKLYVKVDTYQRQQQAPAQPSVSNNNDGDLPF